MNMCYNYKLYAVLIIVIIGVVFSYSTIAIADTGTQHQLVRVGYHPNDDLVGDINRVGHEGYGYEVFKKIESVSNLKFEFVELQGSIVEAITKGYVDIAGPLFKTHRNADKFLYLNTPVGLQITALTTKNSNLMYYDDPQSIDGKTVATYYGNSAQIALDKYLKENKISVQYVYGNYNDYTNANTDYYLMRSGDANAKDYNSVLSLDAQYTYLVSNLHGADILDQINNALRELSLTEGNYFTELESKYKLGSNGLHRTITRSEAEKLKGRTFTVGYVDKHRPYTYTNETGKADGASVEFMNTLAARYGFNVKYVPYSLSDNNSNYYLSDIIISSVGDGLRRQFGYKSTQPYSYAELIAISPNDVVEPNADIYNLSSNIQRAGILMYEDVYYESFVTAGRKHVEIIPYTTFDGLLEAYKDGYIQIAVFTYNGLRYAYTMTDSTTDHVFSVGYKLPLYFSFKEELADEFVPIFNVIFDGINEQAHYDIMVGHMSQHSRKDTIIDFIIDHIHYFGAIISGAWLLLLINMLRQYRARNRDVQHILDTDDVTGHMSSHKFSLVSDEMLRNAQPDEYELISFDIDMFKSINTYYSVEKGTDVIKAISNALHDVFIDEDTIFTRKYGDHFLILRKREHMPTARSIITHKVIPAIQDVMGASYNFSMSIGIYAITDPAKQMNFMVDHVDTARRSGKGTFRTTFKEFDEEMQKEYDTRLDVTYRMENALHDNEFFLVYQPKIDFKTLELKGAEALVRWKTKDGKMFYPNEFIPEFEENGFISRLDLYVFEEVCKFIKTNKCAMSLPIISVNLSAKTFSDALLMYELVDILSKHNISPGAIEFELTESAMNVSEDEILACINYLKYTGFMISIDDFGAGVSSLNRLGALDVDVLKMDKAFLDHNTKDNNNNIVIENTIKLANQLGMKVVAEGVETLEQALWLRGIGCDMAQGYFFERPLDEQYFKDKIIQKQSYNTLLHDDRKK